MNIRVVQFEDLSSAEIAAWSNIQRSEPTLDSPYFRPEFSQAVAAVRSDVEVAVLEEDGRAVGFFPYQRTCVNSACPVGGMLSDFHGLIASTGVNCDPRELLTACGLKAWHFDHLLSAQDCFRPFMICEVDSPYIDLADGFESCLARKENGRRLMAEYRKKKKKLTEDAGPLRYEHNISDDQLFATLLAWKIDQYRRTKLPNVLDFAWVRNLLQKIREYQGDDFSPVLSVLHAGETLAAIVFGMRSRRVMHVWFPAYNMDLAQRSPGLLMWIETMKSGQSLGIDRIDLGYGDETYKQRLANGVTKVSRGAVDASPSATFFRRAWQSTRTRIGATSLARPAHASARIVRHVRHWLEVRSTMTDNNA